MKKTPLPALLVIGIHSMLMAQFPTEFSWGGYNTNVKDQKKQGPCHVFAITSGIEAMYRMQFGGSLDVSELQLYSPCIPGNSPPSIDVDHSLDFIQSTGIVEESCLSYDINNPDYCQTNGGSAACSTTEEGTAYYGNAIPNFDCSRPYCNCVNTNPRASTHYKTGGYQHLALSDITNKNNLKSILINQGPVIINFKHGDVHGNTSHAYLLYGWATTANKTIWKLKDSWPCSPNQATPVSEDITNSLTGNNFFYAIVLTKGSSSAAVYRETYSSGNWTVSNPTPVKLNATSHVPSQFLSQYFNITGPTSICTNATYSVANINLLTSYTVQWSSEPGSSSPAGYVSFSSPNSATTSATAVITGYVNLIATITRPNGILEVVKLNNVMVGVPFTISKISDYCSGSTRIHWYQVSMPSLVSNTCTWTEGTNGAFYSIAPLAGNSCSALFNFPNLSTVMYYDFTITATVAGCSSTQTVRTTANPCYGFGNNPGDGPSSIPVGLYPNPATSSFNVTLPTDGAYELSLINQYGQRVLQQEIYNEESVDVQNIPKGLYWVEIKPASSQRQELNAILAREKILLQ